MNKKISFFVLAVLLSCSFAAKAQWGFSTAVDLQSRYVWRGQPLGMEGPSLQPGATVSYGGLSLDVWGAYNIGIYDYQELDWTLAYTFLDDAVTIMVTDYAFPMLSSAYRYFDYANNHVLEAGIKFSVPNSNFSLGVYSNFYGADARNLDGSMVYSTYAEVGYTLPWESQHTDFDFTVGAALNGKDGYSFYGNDGFDFVNVAVGATKVLEVTPSFKPVCYGRVIANPVANKMFLVCGATIEL